MAAAPKDFYSQKLQPFVAAVVSRNLSPTSLLDESDTEETLRKSIVTKVERNLSLFLGGATKLLEPEEVVRLAQSDLEIKLMMYVTIIFLLGSHLTHIFAGIYHPYKVFTLP